MRQHHRIARAQARRLDRHLQNEFFVRKRATSDQRKLWQVMNTITGRRAPRQQPKVSVEEVSEFFGDIVHDVSRPSQLMVPEGPHTPDAFMCFQPGTIRDVCKLLESVKPHKATDSDAIPGILLRDCAHELAPTLTLIFNRSLATGCVPSIQAFSHQFPF